MAYPSKTARRLAFEDYLQREWQRTLPARSTCQLEQALAALEANLLRTPKRHRYVRERLDWKARTVTRELLRRADFTPLPVDKNARSF